MTRPQAELLLAMLWLENRHGKAVIQGNWGNLSAAVPVGQDSVVNYWRPPWYDAAEIELIADKQRRERMRRLHQQMLDGQEPAAFLAFATPEVGMQRWASRMRTRFAPLAAAAATGDAKRFAAAQVSSGYCPGCANIDYGSIRDVIRARGYFAHLPSGGGAGNPNRSGNGASMVLLAFIVGGALLWLNKA